MRPTQRDIAEYLGMNQSSVSRALRGDVQVSRTTREKVAEAAKALGYEPDPAVGVLASYRWRKQHHVKGLTLAFITNRPPRERTGYDDILNAATAAGYNLDLLELKPGVSSQSLLRILKARGISGILFYLHDTKEPPACMEAISAQYPAVSWGSLPQPKCPGVVRDAYHRVADCCAAMTRAGYQKVVIVLPGDVNQPSNWMQEMHAAWLLHSRGHPGWQDAYFVTYQEPDWDALADMLRKTRPDAIIAANEDILVELAKRGLKPGEDFAFACMDVKAGRSYSGIRSTFPVVAARCVELLDSMIARRTTGKENTWIQVQVRGDWVSGDSM